MSDVWVGRQSRWIQKLFNAKGGPTVVDVSPTIQPIIILHDGVDSQPQAGWNRYCTYTVVAAVAAVFSAIRFRNPAGSNVIAVFEKITALSQGTIDQPNLRLQAGATDFGTPVVSQRMDPRGQLLPTLVATTGTNASLTGGNFLIGQVIASGGVYDYILTENSEIPVAPGDSLTLWSNNLNLALQGSFMWRERALESSELT